MCGAPLEKRFAISVQDKELCKICSTFAYRSLSRVVYVF